MVQSEHRATTRSRIDTRRKAILDATSEVKKSFDNEDDYNDVESEADREIRDKSDKILKKNPTGMKAVEAKVEGMMLKSANLKVSNYFSSKAEIEQVSWTNFKNQSKDEMVADIMSVKYTSYKLNPS